MVEGGGAVAAGVDRVLWTILVLVGMERVSDKSVGRWA